MLLTPRQRITLWTLAVLVLAVSLNGLWNLIRGTQHDRTPVRTQWIAAVGGLVLGGGIGAFLLAWTT